MEAISKSETQKLQSAITTGRCLFSIVHGNKKSFRLVYFCLLVVSVFGVIVYDGNFTNDDPPFHVSQSWIVLTCHCIETRLIRCFGERGHLSLIDKLNLPSRSPPLAQSSEVYSQTLIRLSKEISRNRRVEILSHIECTFY